MSLSIWRALFALAVRLDLRGRIADVIEERFYRACLRAIPTVKHVRLVEQSISWPWFVWCDRGASA